MTMLPRAPRPSATHDTGRWKGPWQVRKVVETSNEQLFFFVDAPTCEIYTLSLHDALPILADGGLGDVRIDGVRIDNRKQHVLGRGDQDRKSTRLNSSHVETSYAVFCLKKKTSPRSRNPARHTHDDDHATARPKAQRHPRHRSVERPVASPKSGRNQQRAAVFFC